eukprot:3013126-Pyramimonas_sp.AAC.1
MLIRSGFLEFNRWHNSLGRAELLSEQSLDTNTGSRPTSSIPRRNSSSSPITGAGVHRQPGFLRTLRSTVQAFQPSRSKGRAHREQAEPRRSKRSGWRKTKLL